MDWLDQRHDVGRDGVVQVFLEQVGSLVASPFTFFLQLKATEARLDDTHPVRVAVAHLKLWSADTSDAVVLALWSAASGEVRIRTAADVLGELDHLNSEWPEQETVTLPFRSSDAVSNGDALRKRIAEALYRERDPLGGRTRIHAHRRRGLVLDLAHGTVRTSQTLEALGSGGDTVVLHVGPGWTDGEIDPIGREVPVLLWPAKRLSRFRHPQERDPQVLIERREYQFACLPDKP